MFFLNAILLVSCYNSRHGRDKERTYNKPYHKEDNELSLNMFLYHKDNNTSQIYYRIDNSQLIYKKPDSASFFSARLDFYYQFLPYAGSAQILDSGTVHIEDKSATAGAARTLIGYIPVKAPVGQKSYLEVFVRDFYSKKSHKHFIACDKESAFSQQNFLVENADKDVVFSNKIVKGNIVTVKNERVGFVNARVEFYANDYSLPPPPFSQKETSLYPSVPDSGFTIASPDNHSFSFKVAKQGIYYVRLDSVTSGSFMVLGVESNFPKVQSHAQMIAASRFIMNKEEYQKLISATDKQAAIEAFWVSLAGSEERAKELIKRYYNRVQDANSYFTSHIEGWKTDMGMIYLIFGTPAKTYKTEGMETWEYYINNAPPLTYRFEKIKNPFSENCYKLQRSINYKDPWTIAVSYWREGRVYLED